MISRFRVTFYEINDEGIEVPLVYILRVKHGNSCLDYFQALKRVHKWSDNQIRSINRNVVSYFVEVLDV